VAQAKVHPLPADNLTIMHSKGFNSVLAALLSSLLSSSYGAVPFATEYGASLHQSSWEFSKTADECRILHKIPRFGDAWLRRGFGEPLLVELPLKRPAPPGSHCTVTVTPPPWRHNVTTQQLGTLDMRARIGVLEAKGEMARGIYQGLEQGMMARFLCATEDQKKGALSITLSPVQFQEELPKYLKCTATLEHKELALTKGAVIPFALNSTRLSAADNKALKLVASYVKNNPWITQIEVAGHTDTQGSKRYNKRLSKKRAAVVKAYLIKLGVPKRKIRTLSFGSSKLAVTGSSKQARSRNRRVQVSYKY